AVVAACALARHLAPDRPLFAGGKSMGGRMTSQALAQGALPEDVAGLIFLGFPLHPARRPGRERARHLADVPTPMLFVQGDRDTLAVLRLLVPVVEGLGPRARLHVVRGGDHGLQVLVRSGRTHAEALDEAADAVRTFIDEVAGG